MTLPDGTITNIRVVQASDPIASFRLGGSKPKYIVIERGYGTFAVLPFSRFNQSAATFTDLLGSAIGARAGDPESFRPENEEFFVVLIGGKVAGVVEPSRRRAARPAPKPAKRSARAPVKRKTNSVRVDIESIGFGAKSIGYGGNTSLDDIEMASPDADTFGFDEPEMAELQLDFDEPETEDPPTMGPPAIATPVETVSTFFNAEFEDHDDRVPLTMGTAYVLAFFTGEKAAEAIATVPVEIPLDPGQSESELTIQLTSDDFEIEQPSMPLRVKSDGRSRGRARFDVTPKRNGRGTIVAVVKKGGNFINQTTFEVNVGNAASSAVGAVKSVGRAFTGDERVRDRDLLLIFEQEDDFFELTISKEVTARAKVPLTPHQLDTAVTNARKKLKEIVNTVDLKTAKSVYQDRLKIPDEFYRPSLAKLAEAGYLLFHELFFSPAADAQLKNLGKRFIEIVSGDSLAIQIVTTRFLIPWPMLYVAERFDRDNIDPNRFLGFRHRIEQIPLQNGFNVTEAEIRYDPKLRIGVNVNRDIDKEMKAPHVADQLTFFEGMKAGKANVEVRDSRDSIQKALIDPETADQIVYFFCHGVSKSLAEGGAGESHLGLTNKETLKLSDLIASDGIDPQPYRSAPLFFINACQSAELSPLFYDGFIPYLMAKGARGVIGTECDTPVIFAAAWAQRFFREFLEGAELGDVVLALRRQFLEEQNNVMGLLYAVHCNGNTRVDPALGLSAG